MPVKTNSTKIPTSTALKRKLETLGVQPASLKRHHDGRYTALWTRETSGELAPASAYASDLTFALGSVKVVEQRESFWHWRPDCPRASVAVEFRLATAA